jgi:predicted RNA-binding Zn-ribbon protein involved in translation (DUF1610 family)
MGDMPCPFCGCEEIWDAMFRECRPIGTTSDMLFCSNCGAMAPRNVWNTRYAVATLRKDGA